MDREFQIIETLDGSPSLDWRLLDDKPSESMHNKKGALSESLYIYHSGIQFVTNKKWAPKFLSIGLGLGYNELIVAAHCLRERIPAETIAMETLESSSLLNTRFINWLQGKAPSKEELTWWRAYYDLSERIAQHFSLSPTDLKSFLCALYESNQWSLNGALHSETRLFGKYSGVLYDAFSSSTCPELWEEKFLELFIEKACLPNSVFVTYAAKGALNRALRINGFIMESQEGFGGKRQSTFALRVQANPTNFN